MASNTVKRGPRKRRRRRFCVLKYWQHCEHCRAYATTYPNRLTAFYAGLDLTGGTSRICINRFGGVHVAIPA